MKRLVFFLSALALAWAVPGMLSQAPTTKQPGIQLDGSSLLSSGWKLKPSGKQVALDSLPMRLAVTSNNKYLLTLNAGLNPPSISVVDIAAKRELGRTPLPDAWLGLVAARTREMVYVGGGSAGKVYELSIASDGSLTRTREFAVSGSKPAVAPFIGDVALSPDERVLYAADLYGDSIAEINLQTGKMTDHWKTGRRPYRIVVSPDGAQLLVSSWAEAAVYQHGSTSGVFIAKLRVGPHPTDMLWIDKPVQTENGGNAYVGRLFVAAANTNTVYSFGVTRDNQFTALDSISVATTPLHPLGMTPSALATDERGTRLYVACSDANAVGAADLTTEHPRLLGFIPVGDYPTAVHVLPEGQLAVLNGRQIIGKNEQNALPQAGSLSFVPPLNADELRVQTQTVLDSSPYTDDLVNGPIRDQQEAFFSRTQERASPIQHVIYVIKGNLSLSHLQKEAAQAAPNHRRFAEEFISFDNLYANGTAYAEGQNWLVAAIVPDYTAKLWQSVAAGRRKTYDFEGGEPANSPPTGYLWNNALQAGVSIRNYGEWVKNVEPLAGTGGQQVETTYDPTLAPYTDRNYRGPDPAYKDLDRAREFVREWKDFDRAGKAPQLAIVRLSNDGGQRTAPTSDALLADNDAAIGLLADSVSHSKLWASTAIFVVEAAPDGNNGRLEDRRIPAFILSPYSHRHAADSRLYNQMNMLRTIECILGLRPMTHFDGAMLPMFSEFSRQPDTRPVDSTSPK